MKRRRGTGFWLDDATTHLETARGMRAAKGQSEAVFWLHRDSIEAHVATLSAPTQTVRVKSSGWLKYTLTVGRNSTYRASAQVANPWA